MLEKELGRGGMGIVYRARQESLGREVALKVLPSFAGMDPASVTRFRREAEAAARLPHPGIVPVYGVGETNGIHYYAMELVGGPSLADLLDRLQGRPPGRLLGSLAEETGIDHKYPALRDPPGGADSGARYARSCAALIADVANALSAAHAQKIIHRDLKPSNVMIHSTGRPVLLDFGLARDEMAVGLTQSGDAVGTPSYMAPEQARGAKGLDARVDIYGLGATLYELLTLQPPFDGPHPADIMRQILDEEPERVRRLNPRVPPALENIVHQCMAKDPDKRYPAIEALELDLRSFLEGGEIEAQAPSGRERLARFMQRNRKAAVVSLATLLVTGIAGVTVGIVSEQADVSEGRGALAQARVQLLENRDVLKAEAHYGRARALLGDAEEVSQARRELAHEAFERFYDQGEHELLAQFFQTLPDAERSGVAELIARVEGRGTVEFEIPESVFADAEDDEAAAVRVEVRAFCDGRFEPEWRTLPEQGDLPMGEYLLRAESEGHHPFVRRLVVERDGEHEVVLDLRGEEQIPAGMVQVVDEHGESNLAVAQTELSRRDYQRFLDQLDDPRLVDEMLPVGWLETGERPDQPARGLSFRQARAAAAHLGAHLVSPEEFDLAATAGLALRYPWGNTFDAQNLAADPDELAAPLKAMSRMRGASPYGVVNLLGNVSEILGTSSDGALRMVRGHFQSEPDSLALDDDLLVDLPMADVQDRFAGTRLARFLTPPDDYEEQVAVEQRRREILDSGSSSLFHDWVLGEHGSVSYRLTVSGVHQNREPVLHVPLVTTGFLQVAEPTVHDGHDHRLTALSTPSTHGEAADVSVDLGREPRRGQGYRLDIASWLVPLDGLTGEGDGYVMRIPVKAVGRLPVVHHVALPEGSRVDESDPEPTHEYVSGGQTHLVWEFLPDQRGNRTMPVVVRFHKDGALTTRWPGREQAVAFLRDFLRVAGSARAQTSMRRMLHPSFLQRPSGLDLDDLLAGRGQGSLPHLDGTELVDFTAVGQVLTMDLVTPWQAEVEGESITIESWPLRVQAMRQDGGFAALRILPKSRRDTGEVTADGSYYHPGLKVRLHPNEVQVNRTQDQLAEMQVRYVRTRDPGDGRGSVEFQVLGQRGEPGVSEAEMRFWLTAGAISMRKGTAVNGSRSDPIGPRGQSVDGESMHWLFGAGDRWARERWTFVSKGLRYFLVKAVAEGPSLMRVEELFEQERSWFDRMAETVVFD